MEEILFSGAGGSGYVKKSARTSSGANPGDAPATTRGVVAPPPTRTRAVADAPDAPRRRRPLSVAETAGNNGAEVREGNWRRTTSRRGLAGRGGRRLRRES